jgi:hypothetical protein
MKTWIGIDFSGADGSWSPKSKASNVWVAEIHEMVGQPLSLARLERVQELAHRYAMPPFKALGEFLTNGKFTCAAIDAPFSLPMAAMPMGGYRDLLAEVRGLAAGRKRYLPDGDQLLEIARRQIPGIPEKGTKRLCRVAEIEFGATRTPLWNDARPGAPFSIACMKLLADIGASQVWNGGKLPKGLRIVEAYPAAQLQVWGQSSKGYDGDKAVARKVRAEILAFIEKQLRLEIGNTREAALDFADALDAIICAFGARAASLNSAIRRPVHPQDVEGWIAIHPPP